MLLLTTESNSENINLAKKTLDKSPSQCLIPKNTKQLHSMQTMKVAVLLRAEKSKQISDCCRRVHVKDFASIKIILKGCSKTKNGNFNRNKY